uniref:Uncharacterized protein LOC105638874 isoform X1 n=1 Tax=Rhizophora mucronata TaxID=61149 RepID=A0A2P2MIS0_RHIMU
MMGRAPEGGCGTDERPCRPKAKFPEAQLEKTPTADKKPVVLDVDFFSQARKALCERSPFDVTEDGPGSSNSGVLSVSTLPNGLASLLKPSDSKKRHKKSHSGADKKSSRASERSKGGNIWVETEEYFRDLALPDIDALFEISSSLRALAASNCFWIPYIGNENHEKLKSIANMENADRVEYFGNDNTGRTESAVNMENVNDDTNVNHRTVCNGNGLEGNLEGEHLVEIDSRGAQNGRAKHVDDDKIAGNNKNERTELAVKTENGGNEMDNCGNASVNGNGGEMRIEDEHLMETDGVGDQSHGAKCLPLEQGNGFSDLNLSSGLEWLLGCRDRILLTSERPSKKRKLLGTDAGLDRLLIGRPCEGDSSLCNFCCQDGTSSDANLLVICCSCKVGVHRRCYGVQGGDESWLCSWCKQMTKGSVSVDQPCVLCAKQGGALKQVGVENSESFKEFAHLFCSLWMPEVYIEDLRGMEPIVNVERIPETRKKLVCNLCKSKCGACVRCSHGTCRTAFHPICAREARHRIEVWGKYGSDSVELRAFCSRHSEIPDDKEQKLDIGQNLDKDADHVEPLDANASDKSGDGELQETGLSASISNVMLSPECEDDQLINMEVFDRSESGDAKPSDSLDLALFMKKLIDRGKVNVKDVALETGISSDSLISTLAEDSLLPDWQHKILKWLNNHLYIGSSHKILKVKAKSAISPQTRTGIVNDSGLTVLESDVKYPITVKSLAPHRQTKSSMKILKGNKIICSSEEIPNDNGIEGDELIADQSISELGDLTKLATPDTSDKIIDNHDGFQASLAVHAPKSEDKDNPSHGRVSEKFESAHVATPEQSNSIKTDQGNPVYSNISPLLHDLICRKREARSTSCVHPSIHQTLLELQSGLLAKNRSCGFEGSCESEGKVSRLEASSNASVCCNHHNSKCNDMVCMSDRVDLEQLVKAKSLGVLELSPADEVEGEIIYFQHMLLRNALARKHFTGNLICKVAKSLPREIDVARSQRWDAVIVNQYLCELREAKKQGRKERRHKEAQAVLAAATAAAAASTRISSIRKDSFDESVQEKFNTYNGRASISYQLMPRPKEMTSKLAAPKISSEKYSDFVQLISDFSKVHPRSCDICRRSETIRNPILVCSSCKVAVHLDCYRSIKESTGPWYCELCEELMSSKCSGASSVNFWEKPYFVAECGLCGGTTGAFRKSSDGQWVHAFCAEWVFEPIFRRGQVNPIEGMETVRKGSDICCVCRRNHGVCIKCCYGHCQSTFHPSCSRSAGFYMNVKTINGKLQHKAYCEKHSMEQRAKAESQKHGVEEIRNFRQIRVELERLRLLCERIIKREKLKRDLVLCSHNILVCKRDHVARSVLVHSSSFPADVSSESATTSLKGNTDSYRLCSDAIQRSDDVTVDSSISVKNQIMVNVSMDTDQRTEDSSTSHLFVQKPLERASIGGKQIPRRLSLASHNLVDDGEWNSKSRKVFEKELIMTSDQASVKNQQLPKGYFYIPVDCLPKEKQIDQDASSGRPWEHGR